MRVSLTLFALGLVGVVVGAYLIATWAVGLAVIVDSVAVAGYGLMRDVPTPDAPDMVRRRGA